MKIVSWNVNSIRARIENVLSYIKDSSPDVLFLQEIKTQEDTFPRDSFKNAGYNSYIFGQKIVCSDRHNLHARFSISFRP